MSRHTPTWLLPSLIGVLIGAVVVGVSVSRVETIARFQVAVSDFVFLADAGPGLGRLPASGDITLVLFDDRSAKALNGLPTYEQDDALYKSLLAGGAKVVADTRMVAAWEDEAVADLKELLEAMVATESAGRLFRDVMIRADAVAADAQRYRPYMAHNVLNMHANADGFLESRFYPLLVASSDGLRESMPLCLARRALGLELPNSVDVHKLADECGIMAVWAQSMPRGNVPAEIAAEPVRRRPYPLGDLPIPWRQFSSNNPAIVPPAAYWISYAWDTTELDRVSYVDVHDQAAAGRFRDQIVLVGFDAATDPSGDTYAVPNHLHRASAVEVVGVALETLLHPRLMKAMPIWMVHAATLALAWAAALLGGTLPATRAGLSFVLLLVLWFLVSVLAYRAGWIVDLVLAPTAMVLAGGLITGVRYAGEFRNRLRIIDLFGRYVPRAVVTQLVQQPDAEALVLGGVKREVTVLFADIRGFTPFAEKFPPEEVLEQLNSVLRIMVDCTFTHEGTVDKFIGDAVLVLFNAPLDQPNHVLRAVRTACDIQRGLADHASGLAVGIGIHRGEAIVGRVGTPERMEYTAVGSTVNVASRLCDVAGKGQIVLSQAIADVLDGRYELIAQPLVQVKGVDTALQTFVIKQPVE